jgi:flagellar hook-length control protein FliK
MDLSAALLEQATVPAGGLPDPVQQDAGTAGTVTTTEVARSASTFAAGATPAPTVTVPENVAASPVVPAAGGPGASSVLGTTSGVAALVPSVTTTDDGMPASAGADAGPDAVPSAMSTAASSAVAPAAPRTGPEPLAVVDGSTHDGATAPATGGAVLPGAVSAAGGPSAGSGDPGREPGGSDSSSPDATPGLSAAAPGSAPAAGATARVDDVAAPTGPPVVPPVSGQIARHLAVMRGAAEGAHSMTLVLRPEHLGPVEIQLTIAQGSLDLSLRGAHEHGRAALLQALPDLRRDLETAGLNCSKLEVDRDTGGAWTAQQHNPGDRRAQQEWSAGGVRTATRAADTGESRPMTTPTRSTSPGVDVRV